MAKLGSFYGLCPLIDGKSLLGIADDVETGSVIVTLGKNISIKYKLSDQKPLISWRTKEKFTSPIVYDKKQEKYVAVFNQLYLRVWSGNEDNLDKLKKIKFNDKIETIINVNDNSYIIFKNGAIHELNESIDLRKTLIPEPVIKDTETIEDVLYTTLGDDVYIGLLVDDKNEKYLLWTRKNIIKHRYKIALQRDGCTLTGYTLHVDNFIVYLLTVWSDSKINSCRLQESNFDVDSPGEIFTVIESISCKQPITMKSLSENYLAIYGPNSNEEGALLIIYNTQFKVTQTKQNFKMFTADAKMYCIDNNIFLPVGQNLAVVPFKLETEQLAALVGSHKIMEDVDSDISISHKIEIAQWKTEDKKSHPLPDNLRNKVQDLILQGLPESIICEQMLPSLIENNDIKTLKLSLKNFYDIPEKCLAKVLKYILNVDKDVFHNIKGGNKKASGNLQPLARVVLLEQLFEKSFSSVVLLPYIRIELDTEDLITLFSYFCDSCASGGCRFQNSNNISTDAKFLEWMEVLFDSSYQKLMFSKDPRIIDLVGKMQDTIDQQTKVLDELDQLVTLLVEIKNGRSPVKYLENTPYKYVIEQLTLHPF